MKEDLLRLKRKLEMEKELELKEKKLCQKSKKYGLFCADNGFYLNPEFGSKTFLEIERLEDTDGFIERFENLVKDIIRDLVAIGQPFDILKFISFEPAFLCNVECADQLINMDSEEEQAMYVLSNSCLKYIPIDFEFLNLGSGYYDKNGNFISFGYDSIIAYKYPQRLKKIEKFKKKHIFAIVDFNKFIQKMMDIGYVVELEDVGPCKSVYDYISYFKDSPYTAALTISISFDLEKTKSAELKLKLKK